MPGGDSNPISNYSVKIVFPAIINDDPLLPRRQEQGQVVGENRVKLMAYRLWENLKNKFIHCSRLLQFNDVDPLLPQRQEPEQAVGENRVKLMAYRLWENLKNKFIRCSRLLQFNDVSYASWMIYLSNAAVMGILTLNIYSASYFLAWRKEGSYCHIFPESANAPTPTNFADAAASDRTITTGIRLAVVSIPFFGLLLTLCIGGLAKASKETVDYLGCVSGLVLSEILYIIFLGGVMTSCMSNVFSGLSVVLVTFVLLISLLLLWGFFCYHPKCLRHVVLCKGCGLDIDDMV